VIISIATYAAAAAFVREARDRDWNVPVANVSFVSSETMLELLLREEQKTGRSYTHNLVNSQVVPSYQDYSLWGVMEYRWIMDNCECSLPEQISPDAYTPLEYSFASFEGLLNAKVLTEMLAKMPWQSFTRPGNPGSEDISLLVYLGIGEPIFLGPNQRQGLDKVYFSTVRDKTFVPLQDWEGWLQP